MNLGTSATGFCFLVRKRGIKWTTNGGIAHDTRVAKHDGPGVRVIAKQFGISPGTVQRISRPFEPSATA